MINKQIIESIGFECVVDEPNYQDFVKDDFTISLTKTPYLVTIFLKNRGIYFLGEPNDLDALKRILNIEE